MRILMINNRYPTVDNPQPGAYVKSQKECLELAGAKVELLVMNNDYSSIFGKYYNYLSFNLRILFRFDYSRFDFIYINHLPSFFFVIFLHYPFMKNVIIHWHGSEIFGKNKFNQLLNKISHMFIPGRFIHIVPSKYFAKQVSNFLGIEMDKIVVSPSGGVDTEIFFPAQRARKDKIVIGFASALDYTKGADVLMHLIKNAELIEKAVNRKVSFKFINYGREKNKYATDVKNIDAVSIIEPISKKLMPDFYNSIDLLLFPTRRAAESLGLVALEAMSCNRPVAGTNDYALVEYIIHDKTGELFDVNDNNSVLDQVIHMINNLNNYNPREFVLNKYSKYAVTESYKDIFFN